MPLGALREWALGIGAPGGADRTLPSASETNLKTHRGEFLGVPATGRRVEFRAFDFHRLEGGRIARSWHLEDNFGLLDQLGVALTPRS